MSDKNSYESARDDFLGCTLLLVFGAIALAYAIIVALIYLALAVIALVTAILVIRWLYIAAAYLTMGSRCEKRIRKLTGRIAAYDSWLEETKEKLVPLSQSDSQLARCSLEELSRRQENLTAKLHFAAVAWVDHLADMADREQRRRARLLKRLHAVSRDNLRQRLLQSDQRLNSLNATLQQLQAQYNVEADPPELRKGRKYPLLRYIDGWFTS